MKFIKLTQIEVLTPVIVAVDQIVEVYESLQGVTVVATTREDTCVAESVDTVWSKLNGVKQEEKTHRWEVLVANEYGKYEFNSGHDTYADAVKWKNKLDSEGRYALISTIQD